MKGTITSILGLAIVVMLWFGPVIALRANTITVTNTNDSGPGSFRQALADANDGDTIDFAVTGTIGLTSGQLLVDKNITISGPGADSLAVDGNAKSRVFYVGQGVTVTASSLTVRNGNADFDFGGGIYNNLSTLTLNNCNVVGNAATFDGGGIYNYGEVGNATMTLNNSTVSGNSAGNSSTGDGGGIYNNGLNGNATLMIYNCTLSNNATSGGDGGGIANFGASGNATLIISNSTFSENSTIVVGGGIYNDGELGSAFLTIENSTFAGNFADAAGDSIYDEGEIGSAPVSFINTIFKAINSGNFFNNGGTIISLGYNIGSDDGGGFLTGPGDQINTDPLLGPLQDNGGPTFTHELLKGSPAIDTGDPNFTPPPFYDQRGPDFFRVRNNRIDVGSFELQTGSTPTPTASPSATATPTATPTPRTTPTPRLGPTARPRPTPPPRLTPVPPPPSPRPTPMSRPTLPPHLTPPPTPSSPRPTPAPRP